MMQNRFTILLICCLLTACADRAGAPEVFVPPPTDDRILIFDQDERAWDISHAVREYGMSLEEFQLGVGVNAHTPIRIARFSDPGDSDHPDFNSPFQVIGYEEAGDARAYSSAVLFYHEVANDVVRDKHFAVVYSPFFEKTGVYGREVADGPLTLAFSGWGYGDTYILYDLRTGSLWYQFEGDEYLTCIGGHYADQTLPEYASEFLPWPDWTDRYPESRFLINK